MRHIDCNPQYCACQNKNDLTIKGVIFKFDFDDIQYYHQLDQLDQLDLSDQQDQSDQQHDIKEFKSSKFKTFKNKIIHIKQYFKKRD